MNELYSEWVYFHTKVKETGGEDWFEDLSQCPPEIRKDVESVLEEVKEHLDSGDQEFIKKFRYNFRPPYCSSVKI